MQPPRDPDQSSSSSSDQRDVVGDGFGLAPWWAPVNPARRFGEVATLLLGLVAFLCGSHLVSEHVGWCWSIAVSSVGCQMSIWCGMKHFGVLPGWWARSCRSRSPLLPSWLPRGCCCQPRTAQRSRGGAEGGVFSLSRLPLLSPSS